MVLTIALFSVGFGAVPFLERAFVDQVDASLKQSSSEDLISQLFDITTEGNTITFQARSTPAGTNPPYVALYRDNGDFVVRSGRLGEVAPQFPTTIPIDRAYSQTGAFSLDSNTGKHESYRAVLSVVKVPDTSALVTLLIALPTSNVSTYISTYLSVFLVLAIVAVLIGGLLTRWLVTLAFRRLGQVETTAMAIAAGNFSQRMPGAESQTEVGRLKLAINTMLGRLDSAIAGRDASVKQMRRFVSDASHELRTPLVTVRGYAELYRMGAIQGEENTAQAMERIEKEAIRMGSLVEDLLALARLDERKPIEFTPVDLRPIARDAALDVRAASPDRTGVFIDYTGEGPVDTVSDAVLAADGPDSAAKRRNPATAALSNLGRRLVRRRPTDDTGAQPVTAADNIVPAGVLRPEDPRPEPIVMGAEDKIRQVVTNLVGNARRYTPGDTPIELAVGVHSDREHAWIAVVDHGDGIPVQQRQQVFERFWRADTSRTRETGGSGLGLAIVASIVESLHGSIAIEETPGGGATFRVSFPLAQQRSPQEHLLIPTQPLERLKTDADGNPLPPSMP